MKTMDYYKRAITAGENARRIFLDASAHYQKFAGIEKDRLTSGETGENGFKANMRALTDERNEKTAVGYAGLDAIKAEYAEEMEQAAQVSGDKLDDSVLKLLNSGLELGMEDWQALATENADNWTMTRLLMQKFEETHPKTVIEKMATDAGMTDNVVIWGQSPLDRNTIFSKFIETLRNMVCAEVLPSVGASGNSFKDWIEWAYFVARDSIRKMQAWGEDLSVEAINKSFPVSIVDKETQVAEDSGIKFPQWANVR